MAGKLVKFVFQTRSDIKQVGDNLYTASVDDGWDVSSRVSFSKDGLEFMDICYGVILSEDMKRDLAKQPWEIGDIFLFGKTMKQSMGREAVISW